MAAMLEKNGADGGPLADPGLPANERVHCGVRSCPVSYTLAYGQVENRIEGTENVLDVIRRTASGLVTDSHPHPGMEDSYVWGGTKRGWLDREAAKVAGL
jgi:hypothetical protein